MLTNYCNECSHSRRCWSDELHEDGYSGCAIEKFEYQDIFKECVSAEVLAYGWCVNSHPWSKEKSGHAFNNVPIVKNVRYCSIKENGENLFKHRYK